MKTKRRRRIIIEKINEKCPFCVKKTIPSYRNYEELKDFTSERAKIYSSSRSGVCSRHQRTLKVEVKRARHLALLPFVEKVH